MKAQGLQALKPSRVREIGARPSATDKLQQGCSKDKPREHSGYREKPPRTGGQKSGISNAGKALQHYGARIYVTIYRPAGTFEFDFFQNWKSLLKFP